MGKRVAGELRGGGKDSSRGGSMINSKRGEATRVRTGGAHINR